MQKERSRVRVSVIHSIDAGETNAEIKKLEDKKFKIIDIKITMAGAGSQYSKSFYQRTLILYEEI